jgi:hypothetical protein
MVLLCLAGTGCGTQTAPPVAPIAVGAQTRCIDLQQVISRHVVPPSSVLFEMSGGVTYRNDLVSACPGAVRANGSEIIQTESQGTRLCVDDSVRIYDPVEAKATGAGSFPKCRLGVFTAVPR